MTVSESRTVPADMSLYGDPSFLKHSGQKVRALNTYLEYNVQLKRRKERKKKLGLLGRWWRDLHVARGRKYLYYSYGLLGSWFLFLIILFTLWINWLCGVTALRINGPSLSCNVYNLRQICMIYGAKGTKFTHAPPYIIFRTLYVAWMKYNLIDCYIRSIIN